MLTIRFVVLENVNKSICLLPPSSLIISKKVQEERERKGEGSPQVGQVEIIESLCLGDWIGSSVEV